MRVRHTPAPVPRTRTELDRDAKVAQIVEAAEKRLLDGGYPALSVAGIARDLGLAQNALYWYFPSKDHLFVAALERTFRGIVARKPPRRGGVDRQVLWFVDQLAEVEHLRAAMREQARVSPIVADFAHVADATWRTMLTNVLADRIPEADREVAITALLATIQGVLSQQRISAAERRRVVAYALERLTS